MYFVVDMPLPRFQKKWWKSIWTILWKTGPDILDFLLVTVWSFMIVAEPCSGYMDLVSRIYCTMINQFWTSFVFPFGGSFHKYADIHCQKKVAIKRFANFLQFVKKNIIGQRYRLKKLQLLQIGPF